MSVVEFVGVRHHSPACAGLVRERIAALRPAFVLVEGPVDMNDRIDELLLAHTPPLAVFSYLRADGRSHASWTPFCDHSPEWVALLDGAAAGAQLRFIDLPAWHPAFDAQPNRYADAERRHADAVTTLCREFAVDDIDALWDHMIESDPGPGLADRLVAYFDLVRGEAEASTGDREREEYMARWVRAARAAAGDRPVLVVTGGFHRPALVRLVAGSTDAEDWPEAPAPPAGAAGGSYLVPYSHRRLDAFSGYQSGLPSPAYYQRLWESGPESAARWLTESVVTRLRERRVPVSTADLVAAHALTAGLAGLRGHPRPTRTDVLDGLVSALVSDDLAERPPWSRDGRLVPGSHPVVAQMTAALTGDRTGRLAPGTPVPPLPAAVDAELDELGLDGDGRHELDLIDPTDLRRSRVLHRLRVLRVPGFERGSGPTGGADPIARERWLLRPTELRATGVVEAALIEAAAHGATLPDAAAHALLERLGDDHDVGKLATVLFDAVLCGIAELSSQLTTRLAEAVGRAGDVAAIGSGLADALGLWRHGRLLATAGVPALADVVDAAVRRLLWLLDGVPGGSAGADVPRLRAVVAVRDAARHAAAVLTVERSDVLAVAGRIADGHAPADLRGAAVGLRWSLGEPAPTAPPAATGELGDWLAGLFALAREEVLADPAVLHAVDEHIGDLPEQEFLEALPALRQAFAFFPPRERETVAGVVLARRGVRRSARSLVRSEVDPAVLAASAALELRVDDVLRRAGLLEAQ